MAVQPIEEIRQRYFRRSVLPAVATAVSYGVREAAFYLENISPENEIKAAEKAGGWAGIILTLFFAGVTAYNVYKAVRGQP